MKGESSEVLEFLFFNRALYNGLAAGLQRQMAFSAIRIGAYETVKGFYQEKSGCKFSSFIYFTALKPNT